MAQSDLVHNENIKLLANSIDRGSTACWVAGVATPYSTAFYAGVVTPYDQQITYLPQILGLICWGLAAFVLHLEARRTLEKLRG